MSTQTEQQCQAVLRAAQNQGQCQAELSATVIQDQKGLEGEHGDRNTQCHDATQCPDRPACSEDSTSQQTVLLFATVPHFSLPCPRLSTPPLTRAAAAPPPAAARASAPLPLPP